MRAAAELSRRRLLALGAAVCGATALPARAGADGEPGLGPLPLASDQAAALKIAFAAARGGDRPGFTAALAELSDLQARRLAVWMLADSALGDQLSFAEMDPIHRDLAAWPRGARRQTLAEKAIAAAGLPPAQTVAWFGGGEPATAEGAMALASALTLEGRRAEAQALIRTFWRERLFEADVQQAMLAGFGAHLDQQDHIRRLDMLLMGPQGPPAEGMLALVPPDWQALAQARMDLRADRPDALARAAAAPASLAADPGLAFEQARWLRLKGRIDEGFALIPRFPKAPPHEDGQARLYGECRQYFVEALQRRNYPAAYQVLADRGFPRGARRAEAEFFAGWVALTRLNDPALAARHFEAVRLAGRSPATQSRALYWLGRAAEARGQSAAAAAWYGEGAGYVTVFYGQLCAEKAGLRTIALPADVAPTAADRAAFAGRDLVKAGLVLRQVGEEDLFKAFAIRLGEELERPADVALLIDLLRAAGEPFQAMMVGRSAASKGVLLPERMFPVISPPEAPGAPPPAFVLAITRQESSFDPHARTAADARGMMMLRPDTARIVARAMGVPFTDAQLWDADYNMRLGAFHLGQLVARMGGSWLLAAAAYNAGPNRPPKWLAACGDPRAGADPVDFIECVPYGETRDYMMRVMENLQVYRARLRGGTGPLTLSADLRRAAQE